MKEIDHYSYCCGVIDCFNEIVHAGVKQIALSHPCNSLEERDLYIPFSQKICNQYHTKFYLEDKPLITDLFPLSMNYNKYNIIYYKEEANLQEYIMLKKRKDLLLQKNQYKDENRYQIAFDYGKLLSYSAKAIEELIQANSEKESAF